MTMLYSFFLIQVHSESRHGLSILSMVNFGFLSSSLGLFYFPTLDSVVSGTQDEFAHFLRLSYNASFERFYITSRSNLL